MPVILLASCSDLVALDGVSRVPTSGDHPNPLSPKQLVSHIDLRSVSRVGKSDADNNARQIIANLAMVRSTHVLKTAARDWDVVAGSHPIPHFGLSQVMRVASCSNSK